LHSEGEKKDNSARVWNCSTFQKGSNKSSCTTTINMFAGWTAQQLGYLYSI